MPLCPSCGEDNPARARFCLACGSALPEAVAPPERRKVVTVVFTDLTGSTALGERLDPEAVHRAMRRYFEAMQGEIERHGGTVEKFIGDAVMAVFGIPTAHEDDALRAVRAAHGMGGALAALNEELEPWGVRLAVRTGVNTGPVVAGDPGRGHAFVTGDTVNVAARLEQAAGAGEILIGPATERLVRGAVRVERVAPLSLKGKEKPFAPFRVVEVLPDRPPARRELGSRLIGRDDELALIERAFAGAAAEGSCRLVTVLGAAGVGKSRLAHEFAVRLGPHAHVLRGRCLPYGEGITFWPLAEVVKAAARIDEHDPPEEARRKIGRLLPAADDAALVAERVAGALGIATSSAPVEEIFWALRRVLEALARERPLVVVFEDIHWGEPTFLDLVEHVAELSSGAPITLLCLARPELLDARPTWASAGPRAVTIRLDPLTRRDSRRLMGDLLSCPDLPEAWTSRIADAAAGNPLFVEELILMLIDDGVLRRQDGSWQVLGEFAALDVPPTIGALLTARLDRLDAPERVVIEGASVIGEEFWRGAVAELSSERVRAGLEAHLGALVRRELVCPGGARLWGEEPYRFGHILIRDAAYDGILKASRSDLHERFAHWLERRAGARVFEYEEILGFHLEQAHRCLAQVAPLDERRRMLGLRAAERLGAAGHRALGRDDMPAAVNLLERAVTLLGPEEPLRAELLLALGIAATELGELSHAERVLDEAATAAAAAGDRRLEVHAEVERRFLRVRTTTTESTTALVAPVRRAIAVLEELGYDLGLARAWFVLGWVELAVRARSGPATELLERALLHARRAGDERVESEIAFWVAVALQWGPVPAGETIRRGERMLSQAEGHPTIEGSVLYMLGLGHAMCGRFAAARQACSRARELFEGLGLRVKLAGSTQVSGIVELIAGDPIAAEGELRRGYEALVAMGEIAFASTAAALLAEALVQQGRLDEAAPLTEISAATAASDDVGSQVFWRTARARIVARRGDVARAVALAREAVRLADGTDFLQCRAETRMALAEALAAGDQPEAAEEPLREAIGLHDAKGNVASAERGRAALKALSRAPAR